MTARADRLNQLLAQETFRFADATVEFPLPRLLDDAMQPLCTLNIPFIAAIDAAADLDAVAILKQLYTAARGCHSDGFRSGLGAGRRTVVSVVHELLGVDEILALIRTAVRKPGDPP
jgi:hypothetical protein